MQSAHLFQLYTQTKIAVARYRQDARSGRKDEPRLFLRFVQNARIENILNEHQFPEGFLVNVPLLSWELSQLEVEANSTAPTDNASDLAAIRSNLDLIAAVVSKLIPKT